jgi:carboxymethylenebutenolidase
LLGHQGRRRIELFECMRVAELPSDFPKATISTVKKLMKLKMSCAPLLAAGLFCLVPRAEGAKTQTVHFQAEKATIDGFLAVPDKPGRYPGVVVIHDWWGLTDWVKQQTANLADQGFVALAVDLYDGKVATSMDQAAELSGALSDDHAILDLMASFVYLATQNDVNHDHIGAVGWAMGGYYALQMAMRVPRLGACVVNYGALPTDPNEVQTIASPVLGNFGADDHGVTSADVDAFKKTMKNLNRTIDVKVYEGAGHSFENPNDKNAYRPQDAQDAWNRTVAFLTKWLK